MVWCVAVGCNNNSIKKDHEKVSFYTFPKDESLKKRWIANIKRENINKYPRICHKHFEDSCFKRDLEVTMIC